MNVVACQSNAMSFTQLIGFVVAIAFCTTGAYFLVSPHAREAAASRAATFTQMRESYNETPAYEDKDEEESEIDDDDQEEVESTGTAASTDSQTAPSTPQTPPTTPTAIPTPKPITATPKGYTSAQVAQHADTSSCWSIIGGGVYDLTSYVSRHPGGERNILKICGKDGTRSFEGQHGGDTKPEKTLASLYIGALIQ